MFQQPRTENSPEIHDRVHVLAELKTLLDSFPPQVRRHLLAQIHSVLLGMTR